MIAETKRMVAVLPVNPKHCPKCGGGLVEDDFPVAVFEDGNNKWHDAVTHYSCPTCGVEWKPEQIPDHPLYEPEHSLTELRIKYKEKITSTVKNYLYKLLKRITVHGR
ncbi:MAG: hypothetical protein WC554_00365 [Clostridia bacterium]